jgi:hypothetical protein
MDRGVRYQENALLSHAPVGMLLEESVEAPADRIGSQSHAACSFVNRHRFRQFVRLNHNPSVLTIYVPGVALPFAIGQEDRPFVC